MLGKKKVVSKKYIIIGIIIIVIIIFIILSFSLKKDRKLSPVESFLKDCILSVEKVITYPFTFSKKVINDYNDLKNVQKDNDILEVSIDRIDSIETENVELRRQLEALKSELNIGYTLTDYDYLNCTVIARNIDYWSNTITIDKGSYNGVEKDMVVINANGLIGKVIRTTTFTSDVRLITTSDTNNKISVHVSNGVDDLYGLIYGFDYNDGYLEVEGISNTKNVSIGNKVYTSGLGGIFPSGILIGEVTDITTDSYDLAKLIKVTPSVNFNDINYVSVLKRKSEENDN